MNDLAGVRIIGIDCAADPGNIAVASAIQVDGRLTVDGLFFGKKSGGTRTERLDLLATAISEQASTEAPTLLAFDAPLGWPAAMRQALAKGVAGSVAGIPDDASRMFSRTTDLFVAHRTGKTPQKVGASLVATLTHTALRLIRMIEKKCEERSISMVSAPLDRRESFRKDVHLIEVYPALAGPRFLCGASRSESWKAVGTELKKYRKEKSWDAAVKQLQECLQTDCARLPRQVENDIRRLRDHGLDAILCAWTGWQFLRGECVSPWSAEMGIKGEALAEALRREGWIWFDRRTPALRGKARDKKGANAR